MNNHKLAVVFFLLLASCHSIIKNDVPVSKTDSAATTSNTLAEKTPVPVPVPNANANLAVAKPEDMIGYWVGMFEPDTGDSEGEGKAITYGMSGFWDLSNKINVSIDSIMGHNVIGHSVDAGTIQSFKGTWKLVDSTYQLVLREPGTNKYDGVFTMSIPVNDNLFIGTWKAYKKIDISQRKYKLNKRAFVYNPNQQLEGYARFADWEKWIKNAPSKDSFYDPGYNDISYYATTQDVMRFNASATLLTSAQLANLMQGDLKIIRNSIYARHGYSFKNRPLRAFFDRQDWYMPLTRDVKSSLTEIEKKNIVLLLRYEKNAQAYYDAFGRG